MELVAAIKNKITHSHLEPAGGDWVVDGQVVGVDPAAEGGLATDGVDIGLVIDHVDGA